MSKQNRNSKRGSNNQYPRYVTIPAERVTVHLTARYGGEFYTVTAWSRHKKPRSEPSPTDRIELTLDHSDGRIVRRSLIATDPVLVVRGYKPGPTMPTREETRRARKTTARPKAADSDTSAMAKADTAQATGPTETADQAGEVTK